MVLTDNKSIEEIIRINDLCRQHKVDEKGTTRLVVADIRGVFGCVFCDFGPSFSVHDPDGEQPLVSLVSSITKDKESVVTVHDEKRHGLSDGDFVKFTEVKGMTELNSTPDKIKLFKVKELSKTHLFWSNSLGPVTFSIGDTSEFGDYLGGGICTQVKVAKELSFVNVLQY